MSVRGAGREANDGRIRVIMDDGVVVVVADVIVDIIDMDDDVVVVVFSATARDTAVTVPVVVSR